MLILQTVLYFGHCRVHILFSFLKTLINLLNQFYKSVINLLRIKKLIFIRIKILFY